MMRARAWSLWYGFLFVCCAFEIRKAIIAHLTLSQSDFMKTLCIFMAGTIGASIALLWTMWEDK